MDIRRPLLAPVWRGGLIAAIRYDIGQAFRGIRRSPGPAGIVVLMTGIAVGLNTSIFSVVKGVLLDPLPFEESDELVHVWADRSWQDEARGLVADIQLKTLREETNSFEGLSALWMVSGRILGGQRPVHTDVGRVSSNFFDLLGVEAALGRTFAPGDDQPNAAWVAVLDHDYWMREFDGDPTIIGKKVVVGWHEMEIIGVLPPDFHFRVPAELGAHENPEIWIPWWHQYREDGRTGGGVLAVVGRTADGVTLTSAQQDLDRVARVEDETYYESRGFAYHAVRLQDAWVAEVKPALVILTAAVGLVLIIAVANTTTILLARNQGRRRELGIRRALGGSRLRVMWLIVAESLVLTGLGGALGVLLAKWGMRGLLALAPPGVPRLETIGMDAPVVGFALVVSIASGIAAATASAVRAFRVVPNDAIRGSRWRGVLTRGPPAGANVYSLLYKLPSPPCCSWRPGYLFARSWRFGPADSASRKKAG